MVMTIWCDEFKDRAISLVIINFDCYELIIDYEVLVRLWVSKVFVEPVG